MLRVFLANATPEQVASLGQSLDLSGTVIPALGFGRWGTEPTVIVELGGVDVAGLDMFVQAAFRAFPTEQAVYVHDTARDVGQTIYRDGRVE